MENSAPLITLITYAIIIGILLLFIGSCRKMIQQLGPSFIPLNPYTAYLLLIPLLGIFWQIYMARSIKNGIEQHKAMGLPTTARDGGYAMVLVQFALTVAAPIAAYNLQEAVVMTITVLQVLLFIGIWARLVSDRKNLAAAMDARQLQVKLDLLA